MSKKHPKLRSPRYVQFFAIVRNLFPIIVIFCSIILKIHGRDLEKHANKSGKIELLYPILVRKNGKEQSRLRVNFYQYTLLILVKNANKK